MTKVRATVQEQKQAILAFLEEHPDRFIFFDQKHQVRVWEQALHELESEGLIDASLNEIEEQYARLEIRLRRN